MSYLEYVTADHESSDPLPELARTNQFTMDDLAANRKGLISGAQRSKLYMKALSPLRYTGGALAGWLLCCFVIQTLVPGIVLTIMALVGAKGIGVVFGAVTLTAVAAFVMSLMKCTRSMALLMADLKTGKADCLEGRVSPSREEEQGLGMARLYGQKHTNRWYVIKGEYFEVDEEAHAALPEAGVFRLYYTPQSKLLLSIEPK